ncbi:hypothetical protein RND81_12G118100 [Saponaria officinalis]|uniref:DUF4378 domain-containing protein n=1 Tax=Saponaria officinalis TaxID=3572 RepID=A0AAW1H9G7_SAPOF
MGREWYFNWGSKSSSKKGGGGGGRVGGDRRSGMPQVATAAAAVAASGGCMNAVIHIFDFNHFHLCLHPNNNSSYLQDDSVPLKGVEAPRNSLESINEDDKDNSFNTHVDDGMKTNRRDTRLKLVQAPRAKVEDTMSQSSCSPTSARTPTLVARLMGLDILPESTTTTPRSSSSYTQSKTPKSRTKTHSNNNDIIPGSQSRPKTPNSPPPPSSSQRRKSTDVVDHHRLSLQINKENSILKELESSRPSCSAINTKRREGRSRKYDNEEENSRSPGYYARQIISRVKETVSRRVGADITNTIIHREVRRDEHLLNTNNQLKPTKLRKEQSSSSLEKSTVVQETVDNKLQVKTVTREIEAKLKYQNECYEKPNINPKKVVGSVKQHSKTSPKAYESIKSKKDEQFVRSSTRTNNSSSIDKKCRKTPLSSDLVHASINSIIIPLKKDSSYSQLNQKLVDMKEGLSKAKVSKVINNINTSMSTTTRLSRGPIQRTHKKVQEEATHKPVYNKNEGNSTNTSTSTSIAECQYISRILKCTGIERDTPISFTRWFSPSHPLNPTFFHTLEATHYPTTTNLDYSSSSSPVKINRQLIFDLVDEILADILKPYIKIKPFNYYNYNQNQLQINGFRLVKTLCTKIRSFPSANCKTLQDIDALVEKDMPKLEVMNNNLMAFEGEGEDIVLEIEGQILDSLVQEITMFCFDNHYH